MEKWKGKYALVTGAAMGIGAAITTALIHHGKIKAIFLMPSNLNASLSYKGKFTILTGFERNPTILGDATYRNALINIHLSKRHTVICH